jgi:probable F420-dependent oxidoreductase
VSATLFGVERLRAGDVRALVDAALLADVAGVHQVVLPDHVVIGPHTDRYPFGAFPAPPHQPWPEPLTVLAAIAARTERVRLGTGVLVAPLRPAVLLAKTVSTLDALSGGRVDLGVGTGWQREEFDASGVPWPRRDSRMDEQIAACQALWRTQPASFRGETVSFDDMWCVPAPVQRGGVPVWFGGPGTARTGRRIAALGAGWLPIGGTSPDEVRTGLDAMRPAFDASGRDLDEIGVRVTVAPSVGAGSALDLDATLAAAEPFFDAGATAVAVAVAPFARSWPELEDVITRLAAAQTRWSARSVGQGA